MDDAVAETDTPQPAQVVVAASPGQRLPEPSLPPANVSPVKDIVDKWFFDHCANGPVSQNTEAWNHFRAALPALVQALEEA